MELGSRSDRRAATYSMLLFRRLIQASFSLGSHPMAALGGTLYRSSDGGDIWSEVLALQGTSVFDIEFAPTGTAYIGTQDSIRRSTDDGIKLDVTEPGHRTERPSVRCCA